MVPSKSSPRFTCVTRGEMSLYFTSLPAEIKLVWNGLEDKMEGLKKVAAHLRKTGRIDEVAAIDLNYDDGAVVAFKKG